MTFTGRPTSRKLVSGKRASIAASRSPEQVARAARVSELRRLVAAGRYRVESRKLAVCILARALASAASRD
jgi:anti-sigma28 factor (negative regulator of flagellin synthesis)